jgi:hypothetical protein
VLIAAQRDLRCDLPRPKGLVAHKTKEWRLKRAVQRVLNRLRLPLNVKISTDADKPKFQGRPHHADLETLGAKQRG